MDKQIDRVCEECGKTFRAYKQRKGIYCTLDCKNKGMSKRFSGNKSTSYKGGERGKTTVSGLAKKYFDNCCAICGWNEGNCDVHHIIHVENGGKNSLSNIIILCPNHHRLVHENIISVEELKDIAILLYSNHEYYDM